MIFIDVAPSSQLLHHDARRVRRVGARTEDMGLHAAFDKPAGVPTSEILVVNNAHGAWPGRVNSSGSSRHIAGLMIAWASASQMRKPFNIW